MVMNGTSMMPNANNITITTALSSCDSTTFNITETVYDLKNLYENNISNLTANVFRNVSIINYNCTINVGNYFQQMIIFTKSVSIRVQILFASIYFDYINANGYQLNGFMIDQERYINLSSITLNNSAQSDACSSGEVAQDPLCLTNLTNPVCTILTNSWNYTCSQTVLTTTTSLFLSTTNNTNLLETSMISSGLNSWQIGLICGLSVLFILILISLFGYFYRRYTHSKKLALSRVNLYDDVKSMQKSGIPQGQAFQQATTIVQARHSNNTAVSLIDNNNTSTNLRRNDENFVNLQSPSIYNQVKFVDHAKIHDPGFPLNLSPKSITPVNIPTSPLNRIIPTTTSRPESGTSINQLKLITAELQEDKLNESDNISLNQSISSSPKKPSTPISRQFVYTSSIDESLHDEDAWMSILDVVNAELAALNAQEH